MKEPAYGTLKKKIVFYDSDKRYADLKVRLEYDGLSQAKFFRGILTGYLLQDPDILNFIDKLKAEKQKNSSKKKRNKKTKHSISYCQAKKKQKTFSIFQKKKNLVFKMLFFIPKTIYYSACTRRRYF